MLRASQLQQELKFEIQVQIAGDEPTAVASFNYHQEHFAETFGIEPKALRGLIQWLDVFVGTE